MESETAFDSNAGFSEEEQQEILGEINALSSENHIAPEAGDLKTQAKKKGTLFPLLVNLAAILLLAGGFAFLMLSHGHDEQDIREGSVTLGLTERRLIQEIRQETTRQISEKEQEINSILSKLSDADTEYRQLQVSIETLTEEQKQRAEYLLQMQNDYRSTLTGLQEERSKILEDSRTQEAALRAQAEERARELSSRIDQGQQDLSAAMEELRRLSNEQDRAQAAESQLGGYYASVNDMVKSGRLGDAANTLQQMRGFLNTPALQGIRSIENRRQAHLAAIASLEAAVAEAVKMQAAAAQNASSSSSPSGEDLSALVSQNEALEQRAAELERTITAMSSQDSAQSALAASYESRISTLQTQIANQQQSMNQKDENIQTLMEKTSEQEERLTEQVQVLTEARAQAQSATQAAVSTEARAAELQQQNDTLTRENENQKVQIEAIRQLLLNQQ
jgi:chromosome segregation ATPase